MNSPTVASAINIMLSDDEKNYLSRVIVSEDDLALYFSWNFHEIEVFVTEINAIGYEEQIPFYITTIPITVQYDFLVHPLVILVNILYIFLEVS